MRMRVSGVICGLLPVAFAAAQSLNCDLREYRQQSGLSADLVQNGVRLNWQGDRGHELRATFAVRSGQPVITELTARKSAGNWVILATDLKPDFEVTSG